jgi:hypothetical protein
MLWGILPLLFSEEETPLCSLMLFSLLIRGCAEHDSASINSDTICTSMNYSSTFTFSPCIQALLQTLSP